MKIIIKIFGENFEYLLLFFFKLNKMSNIFWGEIIIVLWNEYWMWKWNDLKIS